MCDSQGVFTTDEAKVACRQLGILQVEGAVLHSAFQQNSINFSFLTDEIGILDASQFVGDKNEPIFMDRVQCNGEEYLLKDCDHTMEHMCGHENDVGIICHRKSTALLETIMHL